ncbi:ABC transporter ATP-binding protein [Wukongibacter baidiensis]|uniref:ABC transporter ATP-binding protein n=1 Tax=Wukongibacter baidiensis TaxID=1723361 RepID=UPI003D7FA2C1
MLITENLGKVYKSKIRKGLFQSERVEIDAVKSLNLELREGQIVGLLGINGAGKTTSIKMLSTLLEPTKGRGEIDGLDLVKDEKRIKKMINMIAGGERMIYWRLTAKENLWYYGNLYDVPKDILKKRIDELLSLVGLTEAKDTPVERYSKGMKQRLQIARGLINNPNYIFMDEPTLGLDAPIAKELRDYARRLAYDEDRAILLTSHYMHEVEELCEYIYVLDKGALIAEGTPAQLASIASTEKVLRVELNRLSKPTQNSLDLLCQKAGATLEILNNNTSVELVIKSIDDISSEIAATLSTHHAPIRSFYIDKPKLEDAIIKLSRRN